MIKVEGLSFQYGHEPFIQNMSFHVEKGEIFGFLGPSGAGKSTLQKILTGVLRNYRGSVKINQQELRNVTSSFYEKIGVDFEFPTLFEKMSAKENLSFFRSLYKYADCDIETLLDSVGLLRESNKKVSDYSKGMKSRLNFIKALVHNPDVLFLDEPTSGLDPTNARIMKEIIQKEKQAGKTIILTTHNMVDATELCDHVAFIVDGSIKALDSPHNLIMKVGASKVTYTWIENGMEQQQTCSLGETGEDKKLFNLLKNGCLTSIHSSEPTLNDIFIELTGRSLV